MKFLENFIATEINISLNNLETVNVKRNIDNWYILSSNCLIGTYFLKYGFNSDDVNNVFEYTQIFEMVGVAELVYLDEFDSIIDIDDFDEETLKYNLTNIVNYIREYLEN